MNEDEKGRTSYLDLLIATLKEGEKKLDSLIENLGEKIKRLDKSLKISEEMLNAILEPVTLEESNETLIVSIGTDANFGLGSYGVFLEMKRVRDSDDLIDIWIASPGNSQTVNTSFRVPKQFLTGGLRKAFVWLLLEKQVDEAKEKNALEILAEYKELLAEFKREMGV